MEGAAFCLSQTFSGGFLSLVSAHALGRELELALGERMVLWKIGDRLPAIPQHGSLLGMSLNAITFAWKHTCRALWRFMSSGALATALIRNHVGRPDLS